MPYTPNAVFIISRLKENTRLKSGLASGNTLGTPSCHTFQYTTYESSYS